MIPRMSTRSQVEYVSYVKEYILLAISQEDGVTSVRTRLEESLPLIFYRLAMTEEAAFAKTRRAIDPSLAAEKTQPEGEVATTVDVIRRCYFSYLALRPDEVEEDDGYATY